MEPRALAQTLAGGRIGLGVTMLIVPRLFGRLLIGRAAGGPARVLTRGFGARDLAIGLGTLRALQAGEPVRGWIGAGLASDLTDFAAAAAAGDDMPVFGRVSMMAAGGGATVIGVALARSLGGAAPARPAA